MTELLSFNGPLLLSILSSGLLNYLLHSSLLLSGAWLIERSAHLRPRLAAHRETLWRLAFFGPVLTAGLATLLSWSPAPTPPEAAPSALASTQIEDRALLAPREVPSATPVRELAPTANPVIHVQKPPQAPRQRLQLAPEASAAVAALAAAWALLAGLGLLATGLAWWRLRVQARRLPRLDDADLHGCLQTLARSAGLPTPPLRLSRAEWSSPLIAPGGAICLPAWALQLPHAQREAVLAHELAHLRRRDPAWRLAAQLLNQLAWLQPLNRLALSRLDALAEQACDAWATARPSDAAREQARRALAESLYRCAQELQQAARPARRLQLLSRMAATGRSPLLARIEALMKPAPTPQGDPIMSPNPEPSTALPPPELWRKRLLVGGLTLCVLALPLLGVGHSQPLDLSRLQHLGEQFELHLGVGSASSIRIRNSSASQSLDIRLSGQMRFNADQTELESLSKGRLVIDEQRSGWHRRAIYEPGENGGAPRLSYSLDGKEQAPDAEGQAWLRERMALAGESLEGSDKRVQNLLAQGGVARVLADIQAPNIEDHRRRSRVQALLKQGPQSESTLQALIRVNEGMDSDFERRQLLQSLIEKQTLSPALQAQLLQSLHNLSSDFERRQVLETLSATLSAEPATLQAWLQAVDGMDSDFEKRSAIVDIVERQSPASGLPTLAAALQASLGLSSDFEHRSALEAVAQKLPRQTALDAPAEAALKAYSESARRIGSDFERRMALSALLEAGVHQKAALLGVLDATRSIDSDFDRAELLSALAAHLPADAELVASYRQAARGLSEHERGKVEAALDPVMDRLAKAVPAPAAPAALATPAKAAPAAASTHLKPPSPPRPPAAPSLP
ncbi:M56 family metallopeptidase [Paucibacter sp. DJ2R-2]|uniref:M56 family metallopeptidase n=1 Tax=Paucibacter sp. DJ2R-2 TaxID=2893558 RepID=UPI0021E3B20B|nr:M56 family metallopeptidase [Paucibacter sp. DJ2R-2]MCV2419778.1 M56 family metallopeptidase [Paucibacter sp. DJ4R-1]MCV2437319.1 M56 family metallopeptidase [Paucibacter sp. DJ2R-2]